MKLLAPPLLIPTLSSIGPEPQLSDGVGVRYCVAVHSTTRLSPTERNSSGSHRGGGVENRRSCMKKKKVIILTCTSHAYSPNTRIVSAALTVVMGLLRKLSLTVTSHV